ncbi:hypothetical protein IU433_12435 [Nocardia puris]|uniref:hypothetical protein n=1 Tax=Nocardia puris TaxID=208602 RepID=UPI0018932026|nr:hypothetical protein [Nocardia puris]MBF6459845.1 hypothetical protein [Nocardia puris]
MPVIYRAAHSWHPWRHVREHYPHLGVNCHEPLPRDLRAAWTAAGIHLRPGLTQTQRRCALTHEIVHLERGAPPRHPVLALMEERTVEQLAARRLIPLRALTEALMWVDLADRPALAEELWVDEPTLRTRLGGLTVRERTAVNVALVQRQPWNMDL